MIRRPRHHATVHWHIRVWDEPDEFTGYARTLGAYCSTPDAATAERMAEREMGHRAEVQVCAKDHSFDAIEQNR